MTLTIAKRPFRYRWGMCPGCLRERKYTVEGLMVPHRVFIVTGNIVTPSGVSREGFMRECEGTGRPYLPIEKDAS